ncbi:DUF6519 domain-containing protein [Neptunomonas japonica]|uniref:Right handed beta helix domain-containing protein n=1 Tax=Neptunomonas japonica JAMM 1380 TaxID=1441457 RepID=A0A7R6PTY1_9GAMM|nr:DUF6519 domain-containing protein [Neptunomonas japonica]BBB29413.1 conserved hypothetical protein [Neptunomonas japonica JAMM 1380]
MTFDLSRIRFDARKDFLGVVMQQGRVQLDSDWNEWVAQLARRLQAGTLDTFNGSVVPRTTHDGFLIEATGGALSIGAGRIYVDGLLAENHGGPPHVWNAQLAELNGTASVDFTRQPYRRAYPSESFDRDPLLGGGPHLVYVDVWQRDVSALQQPDLIESAIGVDTTGRRQTVWQVKVLEDVGNISKDTLDEDIRGWREVIAPSAGRLTTTISAPPVEEGNPCLITPDAGYRGLENQLYRVEVHTGGPLGVATFKWSRDNATVASRVTHINSERDRITLESIGRDDLLRFNDGDWVEVTDDWRELNNLPGELRRIRTGGGVDETARTLTFDQPLPAEPTSSADSSHFPVGGNNATDPKRNTRVVRWDQSGVVRREDGSDVHNLNSPSSAGDIVIPSLANGIFLEHGIVVSFDLDSNPDLYPSGGEFKSGDHWVFAARSTDASIELLDKAAPLGIHHHFARLARVDFPNNETDFRTLWPAILDGEDCSCTVCVTVENHNNGTATIQQAIDTIKDTGGSICLGIGTYNIDRPLSMTGARSLTVKGQGWASLLVGTEPGEILEIADCKGVTLENFTAIASAGKSGTSSVIAAHNVVDLHLDHINILGLAVERSTSIGIGLSGLILGANINQCVIVAERGVATVTTGKRNFVMTVELCIEKNLMFCSQRAISFDAISMHFGNTHIATNLMLAGSDAALVITGTVLERSKMILTDNTITSSGDGIRAGVGSLTIRNNKISGAGKKSGHGVVLQQGLGPGPIDQVSITANSLSLLDGNAVAVNARMQAITIADNSIEKIGLGALVMSEDASAELMLIRGNRCHHLGLQIHSEDRAFAAMQLIRITRCDVVDNVISNVALHAITSLGIDALRTGAIEQLRVAGNRFYAIGPDRISSSAQVNAVHIIPPMDSLSFDGNHVERLGDSSQKPTPIRWQALNISSQQEVFRYQADASFITSEKAQQVFLLTASSVSVVNRLPSSVIVRGNHLKGQLTEVALNQCLQVQSCLFTDNYCEISGEGGKQFLLAQLSAVTINASNNHLIGALEQDSLHLKPFSRKAIVMGNTSTGPLVVQGSSVPVDLNLTNVIGF